MQFKKPNEQMLPALRDTMLPAIVEPIYPKLIAVIPHKTPGMSKPEDRDDIGKKVNVFA